MKLPTRWTYLSNPLEHMLGGSMQAVLRDLNGCGWNRDSFGIPSTWISITCTLLCLYFYQILRVCKSTHIPMAQAIFSCFFQSFGTQIISPAGAEPAQSVEKWNSWSSREPFLISSIDRSNAAILIIAQKLKGTSYHIYNIPQPLLVSKLC